MDMRSAQQIMDMMMLTMERQKTLLTSMGMTMENHVMKSMTIILMSMDIKNTRNINMSTNIMKNIRNTLMGMVVTTRETVKKRRQNINTNTRRCQLGRNVPWKKAETLVLHPLEGAGILKLQWIQLNKRRRE